MITFKSIGHFFAKAFTAIKNDIPKAQATESTVEAVTASVAPQAVPIEKAAYAVLGEIASILTGADAAAQAKLADAGLDVAVIQKVEDLIKQFPQIIALAKAL